MHHEESFCTFCGRELEILKVRSAADRNIDFIWLYCPGEKWWRVWEWGKHRKFIIDQEITETILNYDPFTGERIKRESPK